MIQIPRGGIRLGIALQSVAMLVLFVAANVLSFENYWRGDFSRSQKFALSAQTRRILREFSEAKPLNITIISSPTMFGPAAQILGDVQGLLAEIQFSGRERVVIESVDPTRNLTRMRELQGKFKLANADNLIVLEYGGCSRTLNIARMADFDMGPVAQGEPPRLLAFRGEQALVGEMIALVNPDARAVYFLQGHGEPTEGIALFADSLRMQNARVEGLSLASSDAIPADAAALVVVSPKFDIEVREAAVIGAWLRQRGRLLVLLDPDAKTPRLSEVLAASGIVPRDDRVLRTVRLPLATGILRDVTGGILPTTEFTRRLAGTTVLFPGATQSLALDTALAKKETLQLRPLIEAAEEFWGERDYAPNRPGGVRYDDGKDAGQPLPIAAQSDRGGVEDDRVEVQTSKLIVVGSAQFAYDASATPQGIDFLVAAVNSLIDRGRLTGVAAKSVAHFALNLTDAQLGRIALFSMVLLPGLSALAGIVVWWARRS